MCDGTTRREFLGQTALIGAAVTGLRLAGGAIAAEAPATGPAKLAAQMPMIKIGDLRISRIILGSNPFFGFSHGNPQAPGKVMKEYYTSQRIMAVMDEAADYGINAVWTPHYAHWIKLWLEYKEKGGKLKYWIGQPDAGGGDENMRKAITDCAKNGAKAICIQGVQIDAQFGKQQHDVVKGWLELIRSFNLPAGMASHKPDTHLVAEEKKLPTDFYHQCLGVPEQYEGDFRERPLATMRKIAKPVIGYKVLGAGRLKPAETFAHVFKSIKPIDGICVGMFPKDDADQIEENVALTVALGKATA